MNLIYTKGDSALEKVKDLLSHLCISCNDSRINETDKKDQIFSWYKLLAADLAS